MKTLPNQTASESAPSKANSTLPVSDPSALDFNSARSIAMQTQPTPKQPAATTISTDLKSLRLPANYGATLGVKKLLTNVLVGKPKKPQFFRTHSPTT